MKRGSSVLDSCTNVVQLQCSSLKSYRYVGHNFANDTGITAIRTLILTGREWYISGVQLWLNTIIRGEARARCPLCNGDSERELHLWFLAERTTLLSLLLLKAVLVPQSSSVQHSLSWASIWVSRVLVHARFGTFLVARW